MGAARAFGRGLSSAELKTYEERWRTIVREAVQRAPAPEKARPLDILLCFDAAIDELLLGRKIMAGTALAPRRSQGGCAMSSGNEGTR